MIQIAIYGKGGIGKSTASANISYSLADKGRKVLQIGCDPKHDSTRALLQGREQTTVLNYIRGTPPYERRLEDIVLDGVKGIKCVEAGGPEPGIGCAGRGILSTFDTLKRLGLEDMEFDVKIYDVLGDVVCGGFAVPLRNEYADGVYLVTSGEFMSIYAANNILKGIKNFDKGVPRVAGVILNCRGVENEHETVKRFADAVELPLVACIPRSRLFAEAEAAGRTVMEMFPGSDVAKELEKIADDIIGIMEGRSSPYDSRPLDDAQMEQVAKGEPVKKNEIIETPGSGGGSCRGCSGAPRAKVTTEKNVVASCATAGAVYGCSTIIDSVVIIHGPRSCAHIMSSGRNLSEIRRGGGKTGAGLQSTRIVSTDMDDTISVFGGAGLLEEKIRDEILEGHKNIFVVTSCVSGIIGDNAIDVVNAISNEHPDVYFRVVEADGNILGEWEAGFVESASALLDMVDGSVEPRPDTVNILAERYFFREETENEVLNLFRPYGVGVNCRFMYETSMDSVRNFRLGRSSYIIDKDRSSTRIAKLVGDKLGVPVEMEPLPIGMREYRRFSEKMGREQGMEGRAAEIAAREEARYLAEIGRIRPRLEGKRVLIEDRFTQNIDWLVDMVADLGMEIVALGIGPVHRWKEMRPEPGRLPPGVPVKRDYLLGDLLSDVEEHSPDVVLTDSGLMELDNVRCATYYRPAPGIDSLLGLGRKIGDLMCVPVTDGWRDIR